MASDPSFVEYACDQLGGAGEVSFRKMFGGYTLYHSGKVIGLVCDNQLFLKPTEGGRALLGEVVEAPPYPGAKPCFLIGDQLEDRSLMAEVVSTVAGELPAPRPRKSKRKPPKN